MLTLWSGKWFENMQRQSQYAALGHAGERVNVIKSKGQNGAAQQGEGDVSCLYTGKQFNKSFREIIIKKKIINRTTAQPYNEGPCRFACLTEFFRGTKASALRPHG